MGRRKPIKSVKNPNKVEYLASASLDFFQTTSLDKDHLVLSPIQRFPSTFFNTEPKYRNNPQKSGKEMTLYLLRRIELSGLSILVKE